MLYMAAPPVMKTLLLCSLSVAALLASGCVFMAPEDRDFYGKGWVKPSDLDTPIPHHAVADPSRPQTASAPVQPPAAQPDTEWLTPVPAQ